MQVSTARLQFSTGDEGWLWYGCQRMLVGDWPLRDFNSYDPGRYLLLAGWARLFHSDKIVVLRYGLALIQWTALFPATLLVARLVPSHRRWIWATILCIAVALWMGPRHKMIDIAAAVWMTCVLTWLIVHPSCLRFRVAGLIAGLFWLIGRNHLLYGSVSIFAAAGALAFNGLLGWRSFGRQFIWIGQGMLVGILPMVALLIRVHGYAAAYWQHAVVRLFEIGSTNLYLPVPWPWRIHFRWSGWHSLQLPLVSLGFSALAITLFLTPILLLLHASRNRLRRYPILVAAAITTMAWAHQGFSRADLPHLAQASLPLAIFLLALPRAFAKSIRLAMSGFTLAVFACLTIGFSTLNPAVQAYCDPTEPFSWQDINGERLYVNQSTAADYRIARAIVQQAGPNGSVLFEPYFPGLYAAFRLRCPTFDAYPLYPLTTEEQQQWIDAIENHRTDWAVIWPYRMDGRPDLGFDRTHPMVWNFLLRNFQTTDLPDPTGDARVLHRSPPDKLTAAN